MLDIVEFSDKFDKFENFHLKTVKVDEIVKEKIEKKNFIHMSLLCFFFVW